MGVNETKKDVAGSGLGFRHVQFLMLFLGVTLGLSMRANISIAIVAMTDPENENYFDWSIGTRSIILSSFTWGYMTLQVPAGVLAARVGGKRLVALCIGANAAVCVLIPVAAYYGGWQLICACRVLQGMFQGFLLPVTHHLIGQWAPLAEKSSLGMFIYAGSPFGTAIQLLISGFIADRWGWPAIFYTNGAAGAIWTATYILLGADSPASSKLISEDERLYIQKSLGHGSESKKQNLPVPWRSIWTSLPFVTIILVHICQAWTMWTMLTEIPSYLDKVLGVNIKENGVLSALPYLAMFFLSIPFGIIPDYVLKKKCLSLTAIRKICNTLSFYGPALALIALLYSPSDVTLAVTLLSLAVGLNAGHITGFFLAHVDMAPNFAGTLMGITNGSATLVSIFAPLACGAILNDETDHYQWRKVFYLTAAFYIAGNTLYLIFGTSERQKWNESCSNTDIHTIDTVENSRDKHNSSDRYISNFLR